MGSSVSVTGLKVSQDPVNYNKKYMFINFNYPEYDTIVTFYEDLDKYNKEENEITPKFCLTDNVNISHCGTFLSDELAKKYILVNGNPCRSFNFRPGSMIEYTKTITEDYIDNKIPESARTYISKGYQCKFIKKDFMVMDKKSHDCCINPTNNDCPKILNNEYNTSNCDIIMSEFCKKNPGNSNCLKWLRTKRKIALETYSNICSDDMDQRYCSEFIRVVRPDYYTFGDSALINFCNKHRGNRNCWCVYPPNGNITLEKYLGPRVCWLHECTDETRDRKWLLYDQDVQRSRCKYTGCNININSLTLENATADLLADCYGNRTIIGDIDPGIPKENKSKNDRNQSFILFGFPIVFISLAVIFYFVIVYNQKRIKTRIINVRRK
ncbi:myristylated membrane protein [Moosepox virus GoldyGopher14]|nr:myristylated membrane protein [Moosepox virus GoldyGopher14]